MDRCSLPEYVSRRSTRLAFVVAAAMSLSVSAFGQTGQSSAERGQPAGPAASAPTLKPDAPKGLVTEGVLQAATAASAGPVRQLGVDDAVKLGLEQNLGIQIERLNPQIQDVSVAQARSFWAPSVSSSFSRNSQTVASTSVLSGGLSSVQNLTYSSGLQLNQTTPWGGNYYTFWGSNRLTSTNLLNSFSPQLGSSLQFQYTQPLLRNFRIDNVRQQVAQSRLSRDAADIQLHARTVQTVEAVKNAYWDLVYQIDNLKAAQESLNLAQQSLKDNTRRVEIGTMAPIDIVDAKAEVARNEEAVIVAQAAIDQAEDTLRTLILDPASADFWTVRIEPTDTVPFTAQKVDTEAAVRNALEKRTDLQQANSSMEQSNVSMRYFRNQILPDVNGQVYFQSTGTGGVLLTPVNPSDLAAGLVPTRTVLNSRGFGSVLGDVFQSNYPQWIYSVQIAYPLGTSTARANLERAKLQYQQSETQLKNLKMQVVAQVRNAARQVEANQKRVESARASRELAEEKLAAEEKKFAAGIRETFFVFQAQRDLATARSAEVKAIADYNKSLVDFEAVQEVAVGGGTSGIITAGSGAIQPGSSAGAIIR